MLPPMALVDADAVIACGPEPLGGLCLRLVGDGPPPEGSRADVYAAPAEACPILPADAAFFTTDDVAGLSAFIRQRLAAMTPPLAGLVLAGGASSRMGTDKAGLDWHGKPQAAHAVDLLAAHCEEVFVSVRPGGSAPCDAPTLEDGILGAGALGAVATALKTRPDAAWLVLACDMPFVDDAALRALVGGRNPYKLASAFRNPETGWPEPLCAIYEPKAIHRLLGFFAAGYTCPRKALINADTWLLDAPDPAILENVNTPKEADAARRRLSGVHPTS
jgi:molybdopterin-guanine dinucleotide biosynthesis protein A